MPEFPIRKRDDGVRQYANALKNELLRSVLLSISVSVFVNSIVERAEFGIESEGLDNLHSRMDGTYEPTVVLGNRAGADDFEIPQFGIEVRDINGNQHESCQSRRDDGCRLSEKHDESRSSDDEKFGCLFEKRRESVHPSPSSFVYDGKGPSAAEGFGVVVIEGKYDRKIFSMQVFPSLRF